MNNKADDEKLNIGRREFISRMGLLSSLALTYPAVALAQLRQSKKQELAHWQKQAEWQTIAQVQELLFPADENAPGAADIGATIYLHTAIENPEADGEDRDFILRGVGWLDGLTQEHHKKTFVQLTAMQQQKILEIIVDSRAGHNWVSMLLTYTLEALLMDPVYGGNADGIGWKWLEHQPGYPGPAADRTWDKLLQRRYSMKAYKA